MAVKWPLDHFVELVTPSMPWNCKHVKYGGLGVDIT